MADKTDTKALDKSASDTAPAASEAPSPILKQGKAPEPVAAVAPIAPAGAYKVIHGTITFGNGMTALTGALVSLSAAEASLMMPLGVIEAA